MKGKLLVFAVLLVAAIAWWALRPTPLPFAPDADPTAPTASAERPLTAPPEPGVPPPAPETPTAAPPRPGVPPAPAPPIATAPPPPPRPMRPIDPERQAATSDGENIRLMLRDFRTVMGENPVGSNAEIMKAVMGGNKKQARLGPPEGQSVNGNGELVDRWDTPIFFHQMSATEMEIRSAGPDKTLYTSDDIVTK